MPALTYTSTAISADFNSFPSFRSAILAAAEQHLNKNDTRRLWNLIALAKTNGHTLNRDVVYNNFNVSSMSSFNSALSRVRQMLPYLPHSPGQPSMVLHLSGNQIQLFNWYFVDIVPRDVAPVPFRTNARVSRERAAVRAYPESVLLPAAPTPPPAPRATRAPTEFISVMIDDRMPGQVPVMPPPTVRQQVISADTQRRILTIQSDLRIYRERNTHSNGVIARLREISEIINDLDDDERDTWFEEHRTTEYGYNSDCDCQSCRIANIERMISDNQSAIRQNNSSIDRLEQRLYDLQNPNPVPTPRPQLFANPFIGLNMQVFLSLQANA